MTIFVQGNCQADGLVQCLALMSPRSQVERVAFSVEATPHLGRSDALVRQRNALRPWSTRDPGPGELLFPRIAYNGFHPDTVRLDAPLASPLGLSHSSLALYGWQRGLSVARTLALFDERVFARLGFFDASLAAGQALSEDGAAAGFPLDALLARWSRGGCFMHTFNHPKLHVMADLARTIARRLALQTVLDNPEDYLADPLLPVAVWPVYPALAARWGVPGSYAFQLGHDPHSDAVPALVDLEEFVARSFAIYARTDPAALACARLTQTAYRDLDELLTSAPVPAPPSVPARTPGSSPYDDLPDARFWRRAIARVPADAVDPVDPPPFAIGRNARIATIGSCFAQRVAHALTQAGYALLDPDCGNVYTARQLVQLFDRAAGTFVPADEAWQRGDGRYVDPFRPHAEPAGFASADALRVAREAQLAATRDVFARADVLIFTLGLTEAWYARTDGAVFPLAPGVVAGTPDETRYGFHNARVGEITADLHALIERIAQVNPAAHIVLTVSPQPPIATYEPRHILTAATYTKAALLAAVDEVVHAHAHVAYFPGYEVVAGSFNGGMYYEPDLRSVNGPGVARVMDLFFRHFTDAERAAAPLAEHLLVEARADLDVLCDEEALDTA